MSDNDHQDWQTVTVRSHKLPAGAVRASGKVEVGVRQAQSYGAHAAAVERAADEGALKVKKVASESVRALVEARLGYARGKLTQEKADAECALPKNTIRDIEAGRLVPNGDVLRKISRTLRVDLKIV
jgi:ribosome-binding protein aMBF1 (putative translation factor)